MNRTDFWKEFLEPSPIKILIWLVSFMVLSVVGEYISVLFIQPESLSTWSHIRVLIAITVGIVIAYILWRYQQNIVFRWKEGEPSPRYKAMVVTLSTPGIVKTLLEYHGAKLEHIWIITNFKHPAYMHFISNELPKIKTKLNLQFNDHPIHFEDDVTSNAQETYHSVVRAINEAVAKYDIKSNEIIIDITGGTKEMTAGVVLACSYYKWAMCYVRSEYAWDDGSKKNNRIEGSEKVLQFDVSFVETL